MRTCIKSRTSSNFGQIGPLTMELAALERLKTFSHRLIMEKWCLHASLFILDWIIIKVAGNQERHKSSFEFDFGPNQMTHFGVTCPWASKKFPIDLQWEKCCLHASSFIFDQIIIKVAGNQDMQFDFGPEFDFGPDQTTHFGVTCPWMTKILHFQTWISLRPVGQSWSNFMCTCSITGDGERLLDVLRQIGSKLWCLWQTENDSVTRYEPHHEKICPGGLRPG